MWMVLYIVSVALLTFLAVLLASMAVARSLTQGLSSLRSTQSAKKTREQYKRRQRLRLVSGGSSGPEGSGSTSTTTKQPTEPKNS